MPASGRGRYPTREPALRSHGHNQWGSNPVHSATRGSRLRRGFLSSLAFFGPASVIGLLFIAFVLSCQGCALVNQTGIDTPRKRYAVSREALTAVQDASVTLLDGGVLSDEQFYRFGQEVILPWRGALIVVRQAFIDGRPAVVELHLDAANQLRAEGESFVAGVQYEGVE